MFVHQVALGDCNELLDADYEAQKLPEGKHSTKGMGQTGPDPKNAVTLLVVVSFSFHPLLCRKKMRGVLKSRGIFKGVSHVVSKRSNGTNTNFLSLSSLFSIHVLFCIAFE